MADAPDNMPEQADGPSADAEGRPNQIVVLRDYCTRVRGADCSRCALACPHDAIGFAEDGRPTIDADACTRCGICSGICDAFSSSRVTMIDAHARIRRIALRGEDVVLTCKENVFPGLEPAANVVVLPCPGPPVARVLDAGADGEHPRAHRGRPRLLRRLRACGRDGRDAVFPRLETAEEWSGAKVGYLDEIPEKENLVRDLANPEGVDRRSAFTNLVSDVGDIASGKRRLRNCDDAAAVLRAQGARARAGARLNLVDGVQFNDFVPQGRTKHVMWPKRQLLLEAIDRNPDIAARVPAVLSETDRSRCTNSLDCVAACPTGARFPSPENGELSFDARYCIGCGLCVDACPQQAIELDRSHRGRISSPTKTREPGTPRPISPRGKEHRMTAPSNPPTNATTGNEPSGGLDGRQNPPAAPTGDAPEPPPPLPGNAYAPQQPQPQQPPYGMPHPPYGQPAQPPYGGQAPQQPYGQPPYGAAPQPPYGYPAQPPYPAEPAQPKRRAWPWVLSGLPARAPAGHRRLRGLRIVRRHARRPLRQPVRIRRFLPLR